VSVKNVPLLIEILVGILLKIQLKGELFFWTRISDIGSISLHICIQIQNSGRVPIENMSIDVTLVDRVGRQNVIFISELSVSPFYSFHCLSRHLYNKFCLVKESYEFI